ncbi:hypothetical protein [Streptomyces luteogriseus]|uniref:hypothetical protein n=1 Tax=Streptomyces luteogriseus TaxID=68233 RepID=UPI002E3340AA|nr:hypothetical protein [Streptomyces luteogriseus]WTJ32891.1 hypothetical protein OID52_40580 [Streptomyces luteogriseus]
MSWPGGVQRYDRGGSAGEGAAEILGGEDFGVGTEGERCLGGLRRAEAQHDPPFAKDFRGIDHLTVDNGRITHVISAFDLSPVIRAGGAPQHCPPPELRGGPDCVEQPAGT